MKKSFLILIAAIMILLAACSNGQEPVDGSDGNDTVTDKSDVIDDSGYVEGDDVTLESMNSWWYLSEDYTGTVPVQIFRLDAASGSWYTYDEAEGESYAGETYITDDRKLFLGFEQGDMLFSFENNQLLLDDAGDVVFYSYLGPGEEMPAEKPVFLEGKWYENGDLEEGCYLFEDNTYRIVPPGADPEKMIIMQYSLEDDDFYRLDMTLLTRLCVKFDDPSAIDLLVLSDDYKYFYVLGRDKFYMREDVIGTPQGDQVAWEFWAISHNWAIDTDNGYYRLNFCEEGFFVFERQDGWEQEILDSGNWTLKGDTLTLIFSDGERETLTLNKDLESLTVERYETTFGRAGW